jgi:hypothetical protein
MSELNLQAGKTDTLSHMLRVNAQLVADNKKACDLVDLLKTQLNSESDYQALQRDEITALRAQLAERNEDAEVGRGFIALLGKHDDWSVEQCNYGQGKETKTDYILHINEEEYEGVSVLEMFRAAGLLPEAVQDEAK